MANFARAPAPGTFKVHTHYAKLITQTNNRLSKVSEKRHKSLKGSSYCCTNEAKYKYPDLQISSSKFDVGMIKLPFKSFDTLE